MAKTLTTGSEWLWKSASSPGVSETGVFVGNLWLNTSTNNLFVCKDATVGAQVWDEYPTATVSVAKGGTGQSSLTSHAILLGNGTSGITQLSVGSTGTVLSGSTGADPSFTATPTLTSITFGAETALSHYLEQQSWSPTIIGGTSAGVGTYTIQQGYYNRIGSMIFATVSLTWTAHTGTGDMYVGNFPFSAKNLSNYNPEALINPSNIPLPGAATSCRGQLTAGSSQILLGVLRSNNTVDPVQMNATGTVHLTITYLT